MKYSFRNLEVIPFVLIPQASVPSYLFFDVEVNKSWTAEYPIFPINRICGRARDPLHPRLSLKGRLEIIEETLVTFTHSTLACSRISVVNERGLRRGLFLSCVSPRRCFPLARIFFALVPRNREPGTGLFQPG